MERCCPKVGVGPKHTGTSELPTADHEIHTQTSAFTLTSAFASASTPTSESACRLAMFLMCGLGPLGLHSCNTSQDGATVSENTNHNGATYSDKGPARPEPHARLGPGGNISIIS